MTEQQQKNLACELSALSVFRGVLRTKPMSALLRFLGGDGVIGKMEAYGEFVHSLEDDGYCFSDFLRRAVLADENRYIVLLAQRSDVPAVLRENARAELRLFSGLCRLTVQSLCEPLRFSGYVPRFENHPVDFEEAFAEHVRDIACRGYGIFAQARMFRVANGEIVPVDSADMVTVDSFVGYDRERGQVLDNTRALVEGRPAANILLFGDAGTGKSSTVKACANYFADRGVRLIELRKDQLDDLPLVMGRVSGNPLKFIIFIDDLSFNRNDDSFNMLKAALEGSASLKAKNAVIYATSNRRHIIKERFSDRSEQDDIHRNDTMQELMSLSDRFGLTVYFGKPDKALYLEIVHKLAEKNGIAMGEKEMDIKAEAFALNKGNRSPRAAEQFVNSLL